MSAPPTWPGNTAECRQAGDVLHVCMRSTGQALGEHDICWYEAAARLRDEAAAERRAG